jgi:hypothetical protein
LAPACNYPRSWTSGDREFGFRCKVRVMKIKTFETNLGTGWGDDQNVGNRRGLNGMQRLLPIGECDDRFRGRV